MHKRIRIRRRDATVIATPAIKPLFEEMSLVRYRTIDDSTGPAYWPDAFLVLEVEPAAEEEGDDISPHAPGRFNSYTVKSVVTGQTETAYQGDLQAVTTKYLEFIIEYYTSALRKFRTHRRSTADYVDPRGQAADRTILDLAAAARPRPIADEEWDEAIPEPEVEEAVEEEEEVPAPLRRAVVDEYADDEHEDRPYVPRARRGY